MGCVGLRLLRLSGVWPYLPERLFASPEVLSDGNVWGGFLGRNKGSTARISSEASPGAAPSRGHLVAGITGVQPPSCPFPALPNPLAEICSSPGRIPQWSPKLRLSPGLRPAMLEAGYAAEGVR